jgi:hypothetical protein
MKEIELDNKLWITKSIDISVNDPLQMFKKSESSSFG